MLPGLLMDSMASNRQKDSIMHTLSHGWLTVSPGACHWTPPGPKYRLTELHMTHCSLGTRGEADRRAGDTRMHLKLPTSDGNSPSHRWHTAPGFRIHR